MTTVVTLGIDPSLSMTGYVVLQEQAGDPAVLVQGGLSSAPGLRVPRLRGLVSGLRETLLTYRPTIVAMEAEIWTGGAGQATDQAAVQAMYQDMLWDYVREVPTRRFLSVNASQVKKYVGAPKKEHLLKEVYRRYGFDTPVHDVADAYVLARIAMDLVVARVLTKAQVEVLAKLQLTGFVWEQRVAAVLPTQGRPRKRALAAR